MLPPLNNSLSGKVLVSGGPNDSIGWQSYNNNSFNNVGGIEVKTQVELREKFPALQEAWEQYLVLLYLYHDKS
jgi:hypothetical protein